eukprot:1180602-Karenia_brevis.AAC.1
MVPRGLRWPKTCNFDELNPPGGGPGACQRWRQGTTAVTGFSTLPLKSAKHIAVLASGVPVAPI